MSYVEKNLIVGEKLLYMTGLHWVALIWPVIGGLLFGLPGLGLVIAAALYKPEAANIMAIGGAILTITGILIVYGGVISRRSTEIAVTNRRVLIKTGILNRRSYEILLPKVESIGIEEGIMGRILGYGSVVVRGTGGTPEPFQKISHPSEFRRQVQSQIEPVSTNS